MRVLVQEKVPAGSYTPLAEEIVQVKYPLTEAYALKAAHAAHLSFSEPICCEHPTAGRGTLHPADGSLATALD